MYATSIMDVSFLFAIALTGLVSTVEANESPARERASSIIAQFDIAKDGDAIVLPVTIGIQQYPFFLSVCSTRTIIDKRLRSLLGASVGRIEDPVSLIKFNEFPAFQMKIGSQAFTPSKAVLCGDISDLREYYGHGDEKRGQVHLFAWTRSSEYE